MKVLAVDTSSAVASVAVADGRKMLGEYLTNHMKTHSGKLLPMVKELMGSLELSPYDIDLFCASIGPGSFTGLRIGVTTVKALAYAVQKPVAGVNTLDALALNMPVCESLICPIMDARNNQVYTTLYSWKNNNLVRTTAYMGIAVSELLRILKGKNHKVIFVGDAVEIHGKYFKSELADRCEIAPDHLLLQRASSVARAVLLKTPGVVFGDCFDLVPFYLRKSQAEIEYDRKTVENIQPAADNR